MKNKIKIVVIGVIAICLALSMQIKTLHSEATLAENITATSTVEVVEETESVELYPALKRVCGCESAGDPNAEPQHYEADGVTVRYGRINSQDVGMCQINLYYHEATAIKMGLDLFNREDNIRYANYLYETQGLTPWNWSKKCWL